MSGIIERASLTQIYKNGQNLASNCKKYKIEKNSYNGELFCTSYQIRSEYSGYDIFVYVVPDFNTHNKRVDCNVDAALKLSLQKDKLKETIFTCVSFTDIYNPNVVNNFVKGLFNEFSDQDIDQLLLKNTIAELDRKLIELIDKYSIKDISSHALVSCSVVVNLLPGIPASFAIKNAVSPTLLPTRLIATNIYKLKKYVM